MTQPDNERKAAGVNRTIKVTYKGVTYTWTPTAGFTKPGGMGAPAALRPVLESMIAQTLADDDAAVTDAAELGIRAEQARKLKQLNRAEELAHRSQELATEDMPVVSATLAAVYFEKNDTMAALDEIEPFADQNLPEVQQILTIIYDDLGRTHEAKAAWQKADELLKALGNKGWPEFQALKEKYEPKDKTHH